jgi:S1-C subfamily serine protease
VLGLYKELRPSVGYFKVKGVADGGGKDAAGTDKVWGGSGTIVAKEANDVLVLTDDHVPIGVPEQHVKPTSMTMVLGNNKEYEATVVARDPAHDLALVMVNTGADTATVGNAVKIADKQTAADGSQNVITMGQPYTSHAIYTSTGTLSEVQKRSDIDFMIKGLPGEDESRPILSMNVPIHEGFSGAGVFNKDAELVSLDDLATSPFTSVSTPVTKGIVDNLIARRTDKPGGP